MLVGFVRQGLHLYLGRAQPLVRRGLDVVWTRPGSAQLVGERLHLNLRAALHEQVVLRWAEIRLDLDAHVVGVGLDCTLLGLEPEPRALRRGFAQTLHRQLGVMRDSRLDRRASVERAVHLDVLQRAPLRLLEHRALLRCPQLIRLDDELVVRGFQRLRALVLTRVFDIEPHLPHHSLRLLQ